jgi:hypothetical protein
MGWGMHYADGARSVFPEDVASAIEVICTEAMRCAHTRRAFLYGLTWNVVFYLPPAT